VPWTTPEWQRWTAARVASAVLAMLLTGLVGVAMVVPGWGGWCSTIGWARVDDRLGEIDWGAVTRGMLLEYGGTALWALPWAALVVLRRRHALEAAVYIVIAAALLIWSTGLLWTGLSDPLGAEQIRCWHF
jgi:hypothetical protein